MTGLPNDGQAPAVEADSSICQEIKETGELIENTPNANEAVPEEHWWQAAWRLFRWYFWINPVSSSYEMEMEASNSASGFSDFVEPRTALVKSNGQVTITSGNGTSLTHGTGQGYESPGIDESPPSGLPDFTEYDLKLMDDDGNERYTYYLYDDDIEMHHWSTNIGDADWAGDADDIYVRFYLSKGYKARNGDDDWVRVGSEEIKKGNLNVGAVKHEWTTLDLHEYYDNGYLVHDGVYNIVVCIDREHDTDNGDGEVPEIHKSNNCTSEAVFIFQESPIPPAERQALVALYDSTNGPGWKNKTGWKTESDPCAWYGVTCSNGHVNNVNLFYNQLSGTIPPEIGNLVYLKELWLGGYQLTGSIPSEIWNLVNLRVLFLYWSRLTGPIPSEIGNLVNLQNLVLGSNQLTGTIPPEIGNLVNLRGELWLGYNKFTGPIPPEVGNLVGVSTLFLSGCQLTGPIPPEIGNLVNLYNLLLDGNQFTVLPPNLPRTMNWLIVSGNNLTFESLEPYFPNEFKLFGYSGQASVPVSPSTVALTQGQSLSLSVDVGGSANQYQWFKDGVAVSSLSTNPAYSKASASVSDSGTYVCQITNTIVTDLTLTTENIQVEVSALPVLSPCPECSGSPDNLTGITFESGKACKCSDATAINLGSGVIVKSGATVVFEAPTVNVGSETRFEPGSNVIIKRP